MAALGTGAYAADQDSYPQHSNFAVSVEEPPREPVFFWQRFDSAIENEVNDMFVDALTPQNAIKWNLDLPGQDFATGFYNRTTKAADYALLNSFKDGAREAVVGTPAVLWLGTRQGWFADLFRGSVDNVGEESLSSFKASYSAVQQSWWKNLLHSDGTTYYGIRPISTSPYAYISRGILDGGGNTVFLANLRYYYDHYSEHRFELALSIPLDYGFSADIGTAYRFGTREGEQTCVVQLIKDFKGHGVAHLGFQMQEHPIILAGMTFTW